MIGRRIFIVAMGCTPFGRARADAVSISTVTDDPIWPSGAPGGGGPRGPRQVNHHGAVFNIATPGLRMVRPEQPNGSAVMISAGGGYHFIEERKEAQAAAAWFAVRGMTAFVLTYRLPGEGWAAGPRAPLQDAMRAIRLIRAKAGSLDLDQGKIGCIGFSAGGHLAGLAATRFDEALYPPVDAADMAEARPDFAILAYPVITLKAPYDHTWSRVEMVGRTPSPQDVAAWSVETQVPSSAPPFFLVHSRDDTTAAFQHSVKMKEACDAAGVSADLHLLDRGGHGFAMGNGNREPVDWTPALDAWLRDRQIL